MSKKEQDFRQMTADTVGKDLLGALVQEIRLLPDAWAKMTKAKQDDVIDRLRSRVEDNVRMAVYTIASSNRTVVAGNLDQITIKDGVKAVIKFGMHSQNLEGLYEAASDSKSVLVVVADAGEFTQGINQVAGEDDQRAMDLGHEYNQNDGGGMDGASEVNPDTGEIIGLPHKKFHPEELEEAFNQGYLAAQEGKAQTDCPIMDGELVIEWVRGFKAWHEEQNDENDDKEVA
ncbi:Rmf/CrpP family protein [Nitrosomonas supralitoralis]|uniref:Cell division protein FtsK n=1 Tax=Nitrosomonas supralitoralis TaxID=2116706 RepID=A0A2P7NSA8_9PROT|nr:Rmf/CrpP family protein [Nitrosomonas supralitoralis]PSJ16340.1 cell division protein FtsK [Nitrosomonas supralitoralis]